MKLDEKKLIAVAYPYFEGCRAGDWNHAKRVVRWVRELGKNESNLDLLIAASYLHDIGWSGVLPKGKIDLDTLIQYEDIANCNTGPFVSEVLNKLGFDKKDAQTVLRLIKAADRHESNLKDEEILVDSDNLSKLCIEHIQEKFQPGSYGRVYAMFSDEIPLIIKTELGKQYFPKLLNKLRLELHA
jgi:HD superfamily phosphodiesterase